MFQGINENSISPFLFSTTLRCLLLDNILNRIELNSKKLNNILNHLVFEYKLEESVSHHKDHNIELNPDQGI